MFSFSTKANHLLVPSVFKSLMLHLKHLHLLFAENVLLCAFLYVVLAVFINSKVFYFTICRDFSKKSVFQKILSNLKIQRELKQS